MMLYYFNKNGSEIGCGVGHELASSVSKYIAFDTYHQSRSAPDLLRNEMEIPWCHFQAGSSIFKCRSISDNLNTSFLSTGLKTN